MPVSRSVSAISAEYTWRSRSMSGVAGRNDVVAVVPGFEQGLDERVVPAQLQQLVGGQQHGVQAHDFAANLVEHAVVLGLVGLLVLPLLVAAQEGVAQQLGHGQVVVARHAVAGFRRCPPGCR